MNYGKSDGIECGYSQVKLGLIPQYSKWHVVVSPAPILRLILSATCEGSCKVAGWLMNRLKCCLNKILTIPDFTRMGICGDRFTPHDYDFMVMCK